VSQKSQIKRPRGRPAQAAGQQDLMRRQLLAATREVFILRGYHGLSVELIVAESGISRPTFYKYFSSVDEAIDQLLRELNEELIEGMTRIIDAAQGAQAKLDAALSYWRKWGDEQGPMLRPLFAELHDAHSPASRHRQQTLAVLAQRLCQLIESLGRPRPADVLIDVFITSIEFLLYRYHLQTVRDEASWQETRNAMLRLVVGLLGNQQDWAMALPIAQTLDINLNPVECGNDG
jgi:TetR/AcrR family transcriptional regulator